MSIIFEERVSDSPYIETITHGWTEGAGTTIRPAECHWHLVIVKYQGKVHPIVTGPLTTVGTVSWTDGAEILWIKFKLGTFMPHLPAKKLMDRETRLPETASHSFYLKGSVWQFPDHENVDTFVARLVRHEVLVRDLVVEAALQGHPPPISPRTVRHRFLRSTGLAQSHIQQIQRAKQAAELLGQGISILDVVDIAGYFDQPHLTRSLKRWIGYTPTQLLRRQTPVSSEA